MNEVIIKVKMACNARYLFVADKFDIPVFNERREDAITRGSRRMKLFGTVVQYEQDVSRRIPERIFIAGPTDEEIRIKLHTQKRSRHYTWYYYRMLILFQKRLKSDV